MGRCSVSAQERCSVAVIIPTVGRPSLERAIASVEDQTPRPSSIVVIDDTPNGLCPGRLQEFHSVCVLRGPRRGPAAARNVGLANVAESTWVAFLDDDDIWLPGKLSKQLEAAMTSPSAIVSCASEVVGAAGRPRIRPSAFPTPSMDILDMFFGTWRLRGSPYYVSTASLLVPTSATTGVNFDETLRAREDIWWVHCLQKQGMPLLQLKEPLVKIFAADSSARGSRRDGLEQQLDWAQRLDGHRLGLGRKYLSGLATRDALMRRRVNDAFRLVALAIRHEGWRQSSVRKSRCNSS